MEPSGGCITSNNDQPAKIAHRSEYRLIRGRGQPFWVCGRDRCARRCRLQSIGSATKYVIGAVLFRAVSCLAHDQCRALVPRLA
jgi:hypothetical protein